MAKGSKKHCVVRRTHEQLPDYQYVVVRPRDGWTYQYADTRAEAEELAKQANEQIGDGPVPGSTERIVKSERRAGA